VDVHEWFEGAADVRERIAAACGGDGDLEGFFWAIEELVCAVQHDYFRRRLLLAVLGLESDASAYEVAQWALIAAHPAAELRSITYVDGQVLVTATQEPGAEGE
jgi:hypothetical protein